MAEIICHEITFGPCSLIEPYGEYGVEMAASYFLVVGKSYDVTWDGQTYQCVAQDASTLMEGCVALGNGVKFGLSGNSEPFAIGWVPGFAMYFALTDTAAGGTHTLSISALYDLSILLDRNAYGPFVYLDEADPYCFYTQLQSPITIDQEYSVIWDGFEYRCVAQLLNADTVILGNGALVGLDGNEEPFIIVISYDGQIALGALTDTEPDKYHEVGISIWDDSAEHQEVILYPKSYGGFELHPTFQVYGYQLDTNFELVVGKQYGVVWDNDEPVVCTAQDVSSLLGEGAVALGNATRFGFDGNGEKFIVATFSTSHPMIASTVDTESGGIHTIGIYAVSDSPDEPVESPAEIVLYNRDAEALYFDGIEVIRVNTRDGGTKDFTDKIPVEGIINLNFSAGDMEVVPDAGKVFSKVTVVKPKDLVPENIAKGAEIAGVTGILESGGSFDFSDENLKYFAYQIDVENKQIILYSILYAVLYEITGSYDVNIPDQIGGYDVIIACI